MTSRLRRNLMLVIGVLLLTALYFWVRPDPSPRRPHGGRTSAQVDPAKPPEAVTLPAPAPSKAEPPYLDAEPSPAPSAPLRVPEPIAPPVLLPISMPEASGRATFDDGTAIANAEILFSVPGTRVALARAVTDAEGRFRLAIPGFGRCEAWFVQDGLRFHVLVDVQVGNTIVVPTKETRFVVSPPDSRALLTVVSLERPPSAFQLEGVPAESAFDPAYRDDRGAAYPGRTRAVGGDLRLRLPVMSAAVAWASTSSSLSELKRLGSDESADTITLTLANTVSVALTLRDSAGSAVQSAKLSAFTGGSPPVTINVVAGEATVAGLRAGSTYRFRSEEPSLEVISPSERLVEAGRSLAILAQPLTTTSFLVVDSAARPLVGASVSFGTDPKDFGRPDAGATGGVTDTAGRWTAYTPSTWGLGFVNASVRPPNPNVGYWEGRLPVGGEHRIQLDAQPYTIVRIHPTDCTVSVSRKRFQWRLLATEPIPLAQTDVLTINGGGRYPLKLLRARDLPEHETTVELEPAVSCEFNADATVANLSIMEGQGGTRWLDGLIVSHTAPGHFEVRGLARGSKVGVVGQCGKPPVDCTTRVEFVADKGLVIELPLLVKSQQQK